MEMDSHIMSAVNTLTDSNKKATQVLSTSEKDSFSSWKKEGDSLSSHNIVSFQTDKLTKTIQK